MAWPCYKVHWSGKNIPQGRVRGKRKRDRQRKSWAGDIKEWTDLYFYEKQVTAMDYLEWRQIVRSSPVVSQHAPTVTE